MSYHMCVWIDHREARVFSIGMDDGDLTVVTDNGPVQHIHRKADHVRLGTVPTDPESLGEVAKALAPAKAILICGPGKARTELAGHLNDHTPAIAEGLGHRADGPPNRSRDHRRRANILPRRGSHACLIGRHDEDQQGVARGTQDAAECDARAAA